MKERAAGIWRVIRGLGKEQRAYMEEFLGEAPEWLLEGAQLVTVEKGERFIYENEPVEQIFMLLQGVVKATDYRIFGTVYDYMRFYPIESLGAMELLLGQGEYKTTLEAAVDCRFLVIGADLFYRYITSRMDVILMQTKSMGKYLLQQARKERIFLFTQGMDRLMVLLMQLYKDSGRERGCVIRMTRQELADSSGLCTKTINRSVKRMMELGYLGKQKGKLIISRDLYHKMKAYIADKIDQP